MGTNIKRLIWLIFIIAVALLMRTGFEILFGNYSTTHSVPQTLIIGIRFVATIIVILIWIGIVIRAEQTVSKIPWLILLTLEPFVGLGLFLTFGRSFRKSGRYLEHPKTHDGKYLTHEPTTDFNNPLYTDIDSEITDIYKAAFNFTNHHAYINDSEVQVLTDGANKFPKLIEELKSATSFILMQYYIIRTDKIGKEVLSTLRNKAKEGVQVYLIYDAIGSVFLNHSYMKSLRQSGVNIVANDKVYFGFFNTRINYRNHRKVTVIDGKSAFIGGMNLGDEYNNRTSKFGYFRDTHLLIKGHAVLSLTQLFFRDWYYNTGKLIEDEMYFQSQPVSASGLVQFVPSGPDFKYPPIRNIYVKMINNAKHSIKIMTPYIALDQQMITSFVVAAKSGVDIKIIIPGIPDKHSIYAVTKSFIEELLEAGIKVYFYQKGFCHAKVFIVDDNLASCGTYNLDNRSARINFEVTTLLYKQGVDKLISDFENDLSVSKKVILKKWKKRGIVNIVFEGIFNLFSPLV